MPKNIVFCADGTWDDPNNNSNVCQFYNALENTAGVQVPIYDSGVGSAGVEIQKLLGGAVGLGLFQKIKDGYSAIAAQYQPGDLIYLFGFSRGAYTVRSLAGMIAICGLPTKFQTDSKCTETAFQAYRDTAQRAELLQELNDQYAMFDAKIQLLGVWDTVGSLGIPAIFGGVDTAQYGFLSLGLHPDVLNAVQALSIDERRMQFQPTLWTSAPLPGQSITQVWFAGVHCDVGGGYPADANGANLSNITLLWMATHGKDQGLLFKLGALPNPPLDPHALATLHDSRTGAFKLLPPHARTIDSNSSLSSSVAARCQNNDSAYSPGNLQFAEDQLAGSYTIVDMSSIGVN